MARARLEVVKGLLEQRRRARDEQADAGAARGRQPVLRQQAGIVGRHAHHDRRARQRFERLGGIEARQEQQARAGEQSGVAGDEQAVHVVQRQGVEQRVRLAEAPGVDQRQRVRGEIAVGQHGALGAPGGARGVEQRREVVVADRRDRRLRRLLVESLDQIALTVGVQRHDLGRSARRAPRSRRAWPGRTRSAPARHRRRNSRARRACRRCSAAGRPRPGAGRRGRAAGSPRSSRPGPRPGRRGRPQGAPGAPPGGRSARPSRRR